MSDETFLNWWSDVIRGSADCFRAMLLFAWCLIIRDRDGHDALPERL